MANQKTDALKKMKAELVDLELKARYWKAQYEIRHYALKAEGLQVEYDAFLQGQQEQLQKMIDERNKEIEGLLASQGEQTPESDTITLTEESVNEENQ